MKHSLAADAEEGGCTAVHSDGEAEGVQHVALQLEVYATGLAAQTLPPHSHIRGMEGMRGLIIYFIIDLYLLHKKWGDCRGFEDLVEKI